MTETTHLGLPFIDGSQAQKHVTHNEALRALDALVMLSARDRDLASPPVSPADGDRYLVKAPGAGGFSGKGNQVAVCDGGVWTFYPPQPGWTCYVEDEAALVVYDGSAWQVATGTVLQNLARLGIGTTADATNPLAAKLNNALFAAKTVAEGGDGDLRYKLSKESAGKTLSFLFQDNYSGRAEIGLTGDDDFHFKVSPDGAAWTDALVIDKTTGSASVASLTHAVTHKPLNGLIFTPGGDGEISVYRIDSARVQNPRTAALIGVSGDLLTLSTAVAGQFFGPMMVNVSWVRIWNTSKTPAQSAWVKNSPASDKLQVIDAAAIAGWASGETIRIGEGSTNLSGVAIDISPMLQAKTGTVFRQQGLLMRILSEGGGDQAQTATSATATAGSYVAVESSPNGTIHNGMLICPTSIPSPVSNSNLLFFREANMTNPGNATLLRAGVSVLGVFA